MAGTLTIHTVGNGELLDGHSWLEYTSMDGTKTTFGTWGNNPGGLGNGLHENLEQGRKSDASRSVPLTDEQEKRLFDEIQNYKDRGADGWGYLSPCSTFAADTWNTVTGENLGHRSYGVISNPSELRKSIEKKNEEDKTPAKTDVGSSRPPSSQREVDSPCEPCRLRPGPLFDQIPKDGDMMAANGNQDYTSKV